MKNRMVLNTCIDCGKERLVQKSYSRPQGTRCRSCSAKRKPHARAQNSHGWKGGRIRTSLGYVMIRLQPDDFFFPMTNSNHYVYEHRLIVAKRLGRCLHLWEIVHHKKGVAKDDNRFEGLQLVTDDRHKQITFLENRISRLEISNDELRKQVRLLQWQVKDLIRQLQGKEA